MKEINGTKYNLCCLDTNILSNIVNHPEDYLYGFMTKFPPSTHIPCFTPFSLYELRPRKEIYNKFLDFFSDYPCVLLKHPDQLFLEELEHYPNSRLVDPISLGFSPFDPPTKGNLQKLVDLAFSLPKVVEQERNWPIQKKQKLREIYQLKSNFQRKKYTSDNAKAFVKKAIQKQVKKLPTWNPNLGSPNINAFPSYKMELYTVFHRFYIHEHRKPEEGDVFDIMISSVTPYIDILLVENFQADIVDQVKRKDAFIKHARVFRLKDIKTK